MSFVASELLGVGLKYLGKKAGDSVVEHICNSLVGSLFGGDDNSEVDADILAKLDQILTGLQQVQDSLQHIEGQIAQVDADINAAVILENVATINSLHNSYFDSLKGLATAAKGTDDASKRSRAQFRTRLVQLSIDAKSSIPRCLGIIHDFVAGQGASSYLSKEANICNAGAMDIIDFYIKMKRPLMKVMVAEIKGIHLLRFASSCSDPAVNFPDGPAAITRALGYIDVQDKELRGVFGTDEYEVVSSILTGYPKPAPASIGVVGASGLVNGDSFSASVWYGGNTTQLWYLEPANAGAIVINGSEANGFLLRNASSNAYISISTIRILGTTLFSLGATHSASEAAIWTLKFDSYSHFQLQPQAYPDKTLVRVPAPTTCYISLQDAPPPLYSEYSFVLQPYQGSFSKFWPGDSTSMKVGERLIPGVYLESSNKAYRLTFEGDNFGVWDVNSKVWKWKAMAEPLDMSDNPEVEFSSVGVLMMSQGRFIKLLGHMRLPDPNRTLVVTDQGMLNGITC
ncbi:hypothetical protein F52700_420 [Fusarium sp. NRRL 52700]|nr:hypothetical protein F52700_420 [Fusarium sp. NRRL 52700]